ncbi:FUSC family protein [Vibrio sp. NTOU-M3]|uniref:FUSC family protein n=1 Tax=Vibrio sp. NTOU-M3 TaxID=3234954 RepID=UPI00349F7376
MNEKLRFATKVALSLTLAYLIPFAMGWPQASTAATTVMLIASTGGQRESLAKGTLRVIGTLVGAVVGLLLVGWFAQDRLLYMLSVSLVVSVLFYFRNAYLKDPTLFMLTGVMALMMSNGGDANGAFIYGIDRAYMTIFGVIIYTLVGTYLFPTPTEQNLRKLAETLLAAQKQLFVRILESNEDLNESESEEITPELAALVDEVFNTQTALEQRFRLISKECSDISSYHQEWQSALHHSKQITELLIATAHSEFHQSENQAFITDFSNHIDAIHSLFEVCNTVWDGNSPYYQANEKKAELNTTTLQETGHLQKGAVLTLTYVINQLHLNLSRLAESISCIDSVTNTLSFQQPKAAKAARFLWWDAENFKTAVKVFVTYWASSLIWIYFNPPGGYSFVIFSTMYMSLLSFMPIHPILLLVLFTFGFLFAVPAYVFILPQLTFWPELAIFIFLYTFIAFYLFKGPITMFFLMGLFILGLDNNMFYHFGIIMSVMTLFYLVGLVIIASHYFPFSTRPEHLFHTLHERYFRHVSQLFALPATKSSVWVRLKRTIHLQTLNASVKKLALWGSKINFNYFDQNSAEKVAAYTSSCQALNHHIALLKGAEKHLGDNPLVTQARSQHSDDTIPQIAHAFSLKPSVESLTATFAKNQDDLDVYEARIEHFFQQLDLSQYQNKDIAGFYILLNLKSNVLDALAKCKGAYAEINWANLQQKRF